MNSATLLYRPGCEGAMQDTVISNEICSSPSLQIAQGLSLSQARDLLDWLEMHGIEPEEVQMDDSDLITIRWSE